MLNNVNVIVINKILLFSRVNNFTINIYYFIKNFQLITDNQRLTMKSMSRTRFFFIGLLINLMIHSNEAEGNAWEKAGCHKVGEYSTEIQ
jgi:hypothetical protein